MNIDETLKDNLIADVENILEIQLTPNEDAALARCFEITIGHHYAALEDKQAINQPIGSTTDFVVNQPQASKTAKEYLQNKYPSMRGDRWNITDIDDNWVAQMMEEYRNQPQAEIREILSDEDRVRKTMGTNHENGDDI